MTGFRNAFGSVLVVAISVVALSSLSRAVADDAKETSADRLARLFKNRDLNQDRHLSRKEFLANRAENVDVAKRDFKLFDLDADEKLSFDEFSTVPTVAKPEDRVALPDPVLLLVDQAVVAMDKSFDNWDAKPDVQIEVDQFIAAFVSTLGPGTAKPNRREADENGDRRVSRKEAHRFLEIQLGVRRSDGKLLREPGGRVCQFVLYQHVDSNKNDKIEREEFLQRSYLKERAPGIFQQGDANGDNVLSFDEWLRTPTRGLLDPVNDFRRMDTNLDARVDPQELMAGTAEWQKKFAAHVFPGFDFDADGTLTLSEYRLSMQANPVVPWHSVIKDPDGDMELSFKEFKFNTLLFPLLRWIVFQRLDVNGDQSLDSNEYFFDTKTHDEFFLLNEDGTGWRPLFKFEGHPGCGSPAVSSDGKLIAFDAWPLKRRRRSSSLFVMNIDGTNPRRLCAGMMPTWSNNGQLLSCSRGGVRIIKSDGRDHKLIQRDGWGAQWSPDGTRIAFTEGTRVKTYDVATETIRTVLDNDAHEFRRIYWNMTWSPDSKRLCFKGTKADGTMHVATVSTTGQPQLKIHCSAQGNVISADSAWHPDGDRVVFPMYCPDRKRLQLYEFDPNKKDAPKLVKGQDATRTNTDVCWTPDGKQLIVVSGDF